MSKRIIAVFMLAGMMLSMAACNGSGLVPTKETTSMTTSAIETPATTETSESTQEKTEETTTE